MLCHDLRFSCSPSLSPSTIQARRHAAAQCLPANRLVGRHVARRLYWPVSLVIGVLVAVAVSLEDGSRVRAEELGVRDVQLDTIAGIDAFILHRHVDHAHEGGLNLGLWKRAPDSIATSAEPKMLYDIFRVADTDGWKEAFEFALPVIGIESWDEL